MVNDQRLQNYFIRNKVTLSVTPIGIMDSIDGYNKIKTVTEKKQLVRKEILFDGYLYDVTDFIQKHPGGSVISYYAQVGEDSTIPIQQFHNRSLTRVKGIMNSLKKRRPSDSDGNI